MKKITELTNEEFPNVNPETFNEWKATILKQSKASIILPIISTVLLVILYLTNGPIILMLASFILYVIYAIHLKSKANKLMKEMGITTADIEEACSK